MHQTLVIVQSSMALQIFICFQRIEILIIFFFENLFDHPIIKMVLLFYTFLIFTYKYNNSNFYDDIYYSSYRIVFNLVINMTDQPMYFF